MSACPNPNRIVVLVALGAGCAWQAVHGADLPPRRPGQWQITATSDDPRLPPRIEDVCLDAATDALLYRFALGASQQLCSKYEWKVLAGGKASVDASCKLGATQITIHGEIVFTGNTAYREDIRTRYEPPLRGRSEAVSVHEAKWTGACAANLKPGDIVSRPSPTMPMSVRINLNDVAK